MTETHALVDAWHRAVSANVGAALATVVHVEGSAYRRPGARMLVTEDGQLTGVISGGCLEGDVRERAVDVMRTGQPLRVTYDATTDDDLVWGLGSGCNGIVHVLIEPAGPRVSELVEFLGACSTSHHPAACATVFGAGETGISVGTRIYRSSDGAVTFGTGAAGIVMAPLVAADLEAAVRTGASFVAHHGPNGEMEVFVEVVQPRVRLVVFGAGPDAVPLVAVARQLGWHVTVVDTQARTRSVERFAAADAVVLCRPGEVGARVALTEATVAVVMTHNYMHDLELLGQLASRPVRYVGCLGPRRRTESLLAQLPGADATPGVSSFGALHAPVGMDIGAEAPAEIALAVAAEILAVLRGRTGGHLHRRSGSIHGDDRREGTRVDLPETTLHHVCSA